MTLFSDDIANIYGGKKKDVQVRTRTVQGISVDETVHHENTDSGEGTWIYSFSDLILNLLMFFVMLSAISSIDKNKLQQVQQALSNEPVKQQVKETNEDKDSVAEPKRVSQSTQEKLSNAEIFDQVKKLLARIDKSQFQKEKEQAQLFQMLQNQMTDLAKNTGGRFAADPDKDSFEVVFATERLFGSQETLTPDGVELLNALVKGVEKVKSRLFIMVQAYTSPMVGSGQTLHMQQFTQQAFGTTSRRAVNVLTALKMAGVPESHILAAAGLGDTQPVLNKASPLNERIVIRFARLEDRPDLKTFREKAR